MTEEQMCERGISAAAPKQSVLQTQLDNVRKEIASTLETVCQLESIANRASALANGPNAEKEPTGAAPQEMLTPIPEIGRSVRELHERLSAAAQTLEPLV